MRRLSTWWLAVLLCRGAEISTGFLIGPKYDARAFYTRASGGTEWQKTSGESRFRRAALGKLAGVRLAAGLEPGEAVELTAGRIARLKAHGATLVSVGLQTPRWSIYRPDGTLRTEETERISTLLRQADEHGLAVELVLFHPSADESFESPDALVAAARQTTDWLIRRSHRNVILSMSATWSDRGWDFDAFVTHSLERLMEAARDRFQALRTDFALPIALASGVKLGERSPLVESADLLFVFDEGRSMEPRRMERPMVVAAGIKDGAALGWGLERASGCVLAVESEAEFSAALEKIAQATLSKPPANSTK